MQWGPVIGVLMLGVIGLVGVYDAAAGLGMIHGSTVSTYVRDWSARWPAIPFLAGLVAGHLFLS